MARATINKTTLIPAYPTLPVTANSADMVFAATTGSSGSNGNQIPFGNADELVVLVQNTDGANPYTFLLTSKADQLNRTGDIGPYTLQANEFAVFTVKRTGFRQADGYLYCESNNAAIKVAAFDVN